MYLAHSRFALLPLAAAAAKCACVLVKKCKKRIPA